MSADSTPAHRPGPDSGHGLGPHPAEPHGESTSSLLNSLRAAVLGANDGIVSVAGLVMGVAGAVTDRGQILVAGLAGLVAGALSMATGEYVSVSTQRDSERALIAKETRELREEPAEELAELAGIYRDKGLDDDLAVEVARQLTAHDALGAHLEAELGIDPDELANPWQAAWASMASFTAGALLPLLTILLFPPSLRAIVTLVAVALALVLTGLVSSRLGGARPLPAVLRNAIGGLLAMGITYVIGSLVGRGVG